MPFHALSAPADARYHDTAIKGVPDGCGATVAEVSAGPAEARKTVAIIGAGPAGLVAAKSMLEAGLTPTVFDRAPSTGGMWAARAGRGWASLRTNLSKYSCGFSDLPWPKGTSMFPTQPEVEAYLSRYVETFLQARATFRLGTDVHHVACDAGGLWHVHTSSHGDARASDEVFSHVVLASGFFAKPHVPALSGLNTFGGQVLHSDDYRGAEAFTGQRVAVVGGSLSAVDIAADLAPEAAEVVHVTSRSFWVIPRYIPCDAAGPTAPFMPLDCVFYRRYREGPQRETFAEDGQGASVRHAWFRTLTGGFAQWLPPSLQPQGTELPMVAISDTYAPWLASGHITLRHGKAAGLSERAVSMSQGDALRGIDAIILCTGYRPDLTYLDQAHRTSLRWDAGDTFMPIAAHRSVFHPDVPNLACVGLYRGPFFGVMEAQARWAAAVFSGSIPGPSDDEQHAGIARELALKHLLARPQFPHGDYIGLMDDTYGMMQLAPPAGQRAAGTVVIPAHYRLSHGAAMATASDMETTLKQMEQGALVAHGVFYGLCGSWAFERRVTSRLASMPSARVSGSANFAPAGPGDVWLYTEDGELFTQSDSLQIKQQYRYGLDPHSGDLHVFFVRGADAGKPFHTLAFDAPHAGGVENARTFPARATHLCGGDHYDIAYAFCFSGSTLTNFDITYQVTGPAKDYTSRTSFNRPTS